MKFKNVKLFNKSRKTKIKIKVSNKILVFNFDELSSDLLKF